MQAMRNTGDGSAMIMDRVPRAILRLEIESKSYLGSIRKPNGSWQAKHMEQCRPAL
jgi:hypothetical protein